MKLCRPVQFLLVILVIATLLSASRLQAQSRKPEQIRPGRLLVAQQDTLDPNFAETVILLVDYSPDGAFGLIVNRPTRTSVAEGLAQLRRSEEYHGPVYLGGPVSRNAVMALLRDGEAPHPRKHIFGDVYLVSRKAEVEAALSTGAGPDQLRLYVGYSGWGPGQLDNEVKRGDWFIFDASEKVVFDPDPASVWPRLIEQTELRTAQARVAPRP